MQSDYVFTTSPTPSPTHPLSVPYTSPTSPTNVPRFQTLSASGLHGSFHMKVAASASRHAGHPVAAECGRVFWAPSGGTLVGDVGQGSSALGTRQKTAMHHHRIRVRPERKKNVPSALATLDPRTPKQCKVGCQLSRSGDRLRGAKKSFHSCLRTVYRSRQHCKAGAGWSQP